LKRLSQSLENGIVEYKQYIVDTHCDFANEFEKLFEDKGSDISETKTTYLGHQFDVTTSEKIDFAKLKEWLISKLDTDNLKDIHKLRSWCIDYHDGGYQTLHKHGRRGVSVVIFLDDQPEENKVGVMYTLDPTAENDSMYKEFRPRKGRAVIITGGIWHGVYPAVSPRRTFVADYKIESKTDGI
jgi:hypothetical protein